MSLSRFSGRLACPLFLFAFLVTSGSLAQTNSGSSAPTSSQTGSSQSQAQPNQPVEAPPAAENPIENQIRLAREAQARIEARRRQRKQAIIQDTYSHKYEIYTGGGYLRFRPGESLQHINEAAWNVGFSDYIRPRLAITGEIRGYYGTAFVGNNDYGIFKPAITQYVFLGGPQYRIIQDERWAVSAQVLGGVDKGIFNGNSANFPGTLLGMWPNGNSFAIGPAVPIDYNLGPGFAVRLSPNYLFTHFGGTPQVKNLGFTAGLVFRFGRQ